MSTTDTEHHEKATATALCACGAAPDGYGLPTDHGQWMIWDQWLREHIACTERDERLRGIRQRVEHLTPKPGEWSSDGLYVTDAGWLLAEVARLDAVVTAVRELHAPQPLLSGQRVVICQCCLYPHPCPTVRALDGSAQ